MNSNPQIVGAVEIGTAGVKVVVSARTARSQAIRGQVTYPSRGIIKGEVVDFAAATECTHKALRAAEDRTGSTIDFVILALTGGHLQGFSSEAAVNVQSADGRVRLRDITTVCDLAKARELAPDRMVLQHVRGPFKLDGTVVPGSPDLLPGHRLEVGYWNVHGQAKKLADSIHVLRANDREVRDVVISGLAAGNTVTSPKERRLGTLVIDVGAGTSDFVLYRNGFVCLTGVLPVGGAHLTNDLALGFRLTTAQAEKLKLRYATAVVSACADDEKVWLEGNLTIGDRQFSRLAIERITAARTLEIFEAIKTSLGSRFDPARCLAGLILTGGMSRLPEITKCAAGVFSVPARLGEPPPTVEGELRSPGYSTTLGLLHFGLSTNREITGEP